MAANAIEVSMSFIMSPKLLFRFIVLLRTVKAVLLHAHLLLVLAVLIMYVPPCNHNYLAPNVKEVAHGLLVHGHVENRRELV